MDNIANNNYNNIDRSNFIRNDTSLQSKNLNNIINSIQGIIPSETAIDLDNNNLQNQLRQIQQPQNYNFNFPDTNPHQEKFDNKLAKEKFYAMKGIYFLLKLLNF